MTLNVQLEEIEWPGLALDPIRVYWDDVGPGQGHVTITCYGCAWTCYFNAMGVQTIRQFFAGSDIDYLAGALGHAQHLMQRRRDFVYLEEIVTAVHQHLRQVPA